MLGGFLQIVFWLCAAILVHHHLAYPWIIRRAAVRRSGIHGPNRPEQARPTAGGTDPRPLSMTLVVPAHNEERYLAKKIRNFSEIDYPAHCLRIVVALDGCTDGSHEVAIAAARQLSPDIDLEIVSCEKNVGKLAVLNAQVARADTAIVALSDTSALIPRDAMRRANRHFQNPEIGVVAATYRLLESASEGERAYNAYLTRIRRDEGVLATPLGVHGSLYFFRRAAWKPLPRDTINDDFVLPMQIVEQGYRGVYDDRIVSLELERTGSRQEFRRRVRIGAGNLQQTLLLWRLADPRRGWLSFMFTSGKGLRPLVPFIAVLAALTAGSLAGLGYAAYGWLLLVSATACLVAVVAHRRLRSPSRLVAWAAHLVEGYIASLIGGLKFLRGQRIANWQPSSSVSYGAEPEFHSVWMSPSVRRRIETERASR